MTVKSEAAHYVTLVS